MGDILCVFLSMTDANKVKFCMDKKYNVSLKIMQTPKAISQNGCSYSLKLPKSQVGNVLECIKKLSVSARGFYNAESFSKLR